MTQIFGARANRIQDRMKGIWDIRIILSLPKMSPRKPQELLVKVPHIQHKAEEINSLQVV